VDVSIEGAEDKRDLAFFIWCGHAHVDDIPVVVGVDDQVGHRE
jgi:hypothetical protein